MAEYKLVDTEKLDADLKSVADSIRAKSGKVDTLSFPEGFKTAVETQLPSKAEYEKYLSFFQGQVTSISPDETPAHIREYMFASQTRLTYFDFSKTISIGEGAFLHCTSLNFGALPENVELLYNQTFRGCYKLTLTELPKSLTSIGDNCFQYCFKLALTEIPENVTYIGSYAFSQCDLITELTFKCNSSSLYISSISFIGCPNLTTINVPWAEGEIANAPWGATNATINYNYTETEG